MSEATEQADFRLADDQGYILDRGHLATARLNLQHFLWQRCLGFVLHSAVKLPAEARVADVATGTALWALDLADERPGVQVECMDVDLSQAPAPAWLPAGVTLREWDILKDPPAELLGTFDLVHVRLLVLVLSGHDPRPVIQRLKALLKPGGWLQWEDLDCTRMHVKRATPDVLSPSLDAIIEMSKSGGRHDWVVKLADMAGEQGFVDAQIQDYDDPVKLSRAFNDQHLMTMEEFASGLLKIGKKEPAANVLGLVKQGYKESLNGASICYPRVCCVARKP